jgi:GDP-D-mannose 3',5'-epimerase
MWGDGNQTRSFTYIDDCIEGILRLTKSDFAEPVNLGSDEMVSMKQMQALALDPKPYTLNPKPCTLITKP